MKESMAYTALRTSAAAWSLCVLFAVARPAAMAQTMELVGGTLTVSQGTRIAVNGPIQWTLVPEAQLVNNGRIELGTQATLLESDASPVIGIGTEHALIVQGGALSNFEAGGLGLSISTAGIGTTELVRGHQVLLNNGVDESIARWYRLEPPPPADSELDLVLSYAASELNGLDANTLALFLGDGLAGSWSFLPGDANATERSVSATWNGPWAPVITAFPEGISTNVPAPSPTSALAVWPSPTADLLWVRGMDETLREIQLLDANGRVLREFRTSAAQETATLSLAGLPSGLYLLRVNGVHSTRVVKE